MKRNTNEPGGMKSLTNFQVSKIKLEVRIVKWKKATLGMESLTCCQDNKIRLEVKAVTRDIEAKPGIESLTSCQENRTKLRVGSEDSKKEHSWIWHEITHLL